MNFKNLVIFPLKAVPILVLGKVLENAALCNIAFSRLARVRLLKVTHMAWSRWVRLLI